MDALEADHRETIERMADEMRCSCARCSRRGLMGPVILITIGVLFLLEQLHVASFNHLWPVILLVVGVIKLLEATASTSGHIGPQPPQPPSPPPSAT
jgi:hypothetical protein